MQLQLMHTPCTQSRYLVHALGAKSAYVLFLASDLRCASTPILKTTLGSRSPLQTTSVCMHSDTLLFYSGLRVDNWNNNTWVTFLNIFIVWEDKDGYNRQAPATG